MSLKVHLVDGGFYLGKRGKKDEDGERVKKQTQDHRVPEDRF